MLQLSASLINKSIMSLRTGSAVATVTGIIFNPNNLKVEGFYCEDRFNKQELILLPQDIREILTRGFVINDHEVLAEEDELVRLKKVLDIDYQLIGKQVVTTDKQKVGKVSDFAVELESMVVQKVYVSQSLIKSFTGGSLSIDRSQIVELTPHKVIINELLKGSRVPATAVAS